MKKLRLSAQDHASDLQGEMPEVKQVSYRCEFLEHSGDIRVVLIALAALFCNNQSSIATCHF